MISRLSVIHKNFKGLRNKNPKVYDLLESVQDFNNEDKPWLSILCKRTNKIKHDNLLKQRRNDNYQVDIPGFGTFVNSSVTVKNSVMVNNNGEVIPLDFSIDYEGNITGKQSVIERLSIEKIDWVTFTIAGTNRDVLEFLTQCKNEIQHMVEQVYLALGC